MREEVAVVRVLDLGRAGDAEGAAPGEEAALTLLGRGHGSRGEGEGDGEDERRDGDHGGRV